jgi:flagellar basal body rod protein FlgG
VGGGVLLSGIKTDFSPGTLRRTGIPTDMAVGNDTFFKVRRDDGDFLTRAGNFMFDNTGRLVTQDNHPVLDDGGQPIQIDTDRPWQLSADGSIVQDGNSQKLGLVRANSMGDLVKVGENLFRSLAPTQPVDDADRQVSGGMLEQSDVKPASEMIELIEASRAFEANMNMIKNHDEMLSTLTSRVLKSS